jgi:hypothetical protein
LLSVSVQALLTGLVVNINLDGSGRVVAAEQQEFKFQTQTQKSLLVVIWYVVQTLWLLLFGKVVKLLKVF